MRRFLLPGLLGLLALLLLAAFNLPARILPAMLDTPQLQLSGLSGTLSRGTAARAIVSTPSGYLHLGALSWQLQLSGLSPSLLLRSVWGDQRASFRLRRSAGLTYLNDVDVTADAGLIRHALPVDLTGSVGLLFEELVLAPDRLLRAEGRIVWQDASWRASSGSRGLGSYAARMTTVAEGNVTAQVETLAGPVSVQGTVGLEQRRYSADLRIDSGQPGLDPELAQALSLIASSEENGYRLRLNGELAPSP